MAENTKSKTFRSRADRLDLPMAALAGASVAFFTWAMPSGLFESLVSATGLPSVLAAARPPLGETARLAVVAAGGLVAFGLVWLLLRALGRKPAAAPVVAPFEAAVEEPTRLRRFGGQSEASPAPQPRAGADLGVPLDAVAGSRGEPVEVSEIEGVDFEAEWERPTPSFLRTGLDEPTASEEPSPTVEPDAPEAEGAQAEVVEPADVPFWIPEEAETAVEQPEPVEADSSPPAQEGDPVILPFWAQRTESENVDEPTPAAEPSLDQLANRLEGGLIRRKRHGRSTRPRGYGALDEQLRGAIDDLSKASRRS